MLKRPDKANPTLRSKTYFVFFVLLVSFGIIIARVSHLQFVIKDDLISYSEDQFIRKAKIYPNRGQIYDRNGNPLAINIQNYNIFTMPKELSASKKELVKLGRLIKDLNTNKLLQKIKGRKKFTWLLRDTNLTDEQIEEIKKLKGVYYEPTTSRLYPNNELASQILGFVGIDNRGLSGVEHRYDEMLQGKEKTISYLRDAKGRSLKFENLTSSKSSEDIYLSIDKEIQGVLEREIKEGVQRHGADRGGAGVIDATTGEILAMANFPTFDPNNHSASKPTHRKLSFVSDPFEPGSVLKTLTIASALENEVVNPSTIFYCENGRFKVNDHYIKESAGHKFKWLSVTDILKESSNVGTTKIAFELGYKNLFHTFQDFGLGRKTGIEVSAESRGIFEKEKRVSNLRLSNLSFGQGVAVTGIQMLVSYLPFVNGGFLIKPTLIKRHSNPERIQVISKETARKVSNMLEQTVETGTGEKAKIKNYRIAGKTGTAQKPSPQGGYEGYISSFVGFPIGVKKPFITFVYIDNPKRNGFYGNEVAAPIFKKIVEKVLFKNSEFETLAKNLDQVKEGTDELNVSQAAPQRVKEGQVPNLIGLDKKSVLRLAEKHKLKIRINGYGVVVDQSPKPFSPMQGHTVKVYLKSPHYE